MVYKLVKGTLTNKLGMSRIQINLTILSMITIIVQGIGFYFIDKNMNLKLFIFVVLFGFIYNIVYYKTYLN